MIPGCSGGPAQWALASSTICLASDSSIVRIWRASALGGLVRSRRDELDQRGDRAPVVLAVGDEVEMGRAPILDQRRPGVPAQTPIQLLHIAATGATRGHGVSLVGALGKQPHEVFARPVAAERAHEARERPVRRAEVTRELASPVLEKVGEAGRGAAAGTDAQIPFAGRDVLSALGEVRGKRRAQAGDCQEGEGLLRELAAFLDLERADSPALGKKPRRFDLPPVPALRERVDVFLQSRQHVEAGTEEILEAIGLDDGWRPGEEWLAPRPARVARLLGPGERRDRVGGPCLPRRKYSAERLQGLAEGRTALEEVLPFAEQRHATP